MLLKGRQFLPLVNMTRTADFLGVFESFMLDCKLVLNNIFLIEKIFRIPKSFCGSCEITNEAQFNQCPKNDSHNNLVSVS